jgi:hypothetical protein
MNSSTPEKKDLKTLFVGSLGSVEPLRMAFQFLPPVNSAQEATSLRDAMSLLRRGDWTEVAIAIDGQEYSSQTAFNWILRVRQDFPEVLFALIGSQAAISDALRDTPTPQRDRLGHYLRLPVDATPDELERLAREFLRLRKATAAPQRKTPRYRYDVAISYTHEDRALAAALNDQLRRRELEVYFDSTNQHEMWGTDLTPRLRSIYHRESRFVLVIASKAYRSTDWSRHEYEILQERSTQASTLDFLLIVRLEAVDLPNVPGSFVYLEAKIGVSAIAEVVEKRMGTLLASNDFAA